MKHTIIALGLLLLVTLGVVLNSSFVVSSVSDISAAIRELPNTKEEFADGKAAAEKAAEILELWKNKVWGFELTMLLGESEAIVLLLTDLEQYSRLGEFEHFKVTAERLNIILERFSESEKFSFSSVL